MAFSTNGTVTLDEDDLTPADEQLLEMLQEGRITAPYASDETDYSKQYIRDRLSTMIDHGHVRKVYQGLYELVADPRDEDPDEEDLRGDGAGAIGAHAPTDVDQTIEDVVQDWRPGNDLNRREQRRAAGRAVLEFLRDREVAQAQEFRDELEAEYPVDGQSPKTWWTKTARACLKQAEDAGLVWMDDNKDWHWHTDRDQEGSDE